MEKTSVLYVPITQEDDAETAQNGVTVTAVPVGRKTRFYNPETGVTYQKTVLLKTVTAISGSTFNGQAAVPGLARLRLTRNSVVDGGLSWAITVKGRTDEIFMPDNDTGLGELVSRDSVSQPSFEGAKYTDLLDTPNDYGTAGQAVIVNSSSTGLSYGSGAAPPPSWSYDNFWAESAPMVGVTWPQFTLSPSAPVGTFRYDGAYLTPPDQRPAVDFQLPLVPPEGITAVVFVVATETDVPIDLVYYSWGALSIRELFYYNPGQITPVAEQYRDFLVAGQELRRLELNPTKFPDGPGWRITIYPYGVGVDHSSLPKIRICPAT